MWAKYMKLLENFAFCMIMAVFVFICMLIDISADRTSWAIFNCVGTVAWLGLAYRAINKKHDEHKDLTPDDVRATLKFLYDVEAATNRIIVDKEAELERMLKETNDAGTRHTSESKDSKASQDGAD